MDKFGLWLNREKKKGRVSGEIPSVSAFAHIPDLFELTYSQAVALTDWTPVEPQKIAAPKKVWVFLNGKVNFGETLHMLLRDLASSKASSNLANQWTNHVEIPPGHPDAVAHGEISPKGRVRIWESNCDRNQVMNAVEAAKMKTSALTPGIDQIPGLEMEGQKKFAIGDRDPNQGYETGFADPTKDEARKLAPESERIPEDIVNHVKETVNDIDTGWYLSQDPQEWNEAVQNAMRVALLSPRKGFEWNAAHYQDIMHLPADASANDLFRSLETARTAHNLAAGHNPHTHTRFGKAQRLVAKRVIEMDPHISDDDAKGIALEVLGNDIGTAETAFLHARMNDPQYYDQENGEWKQSPSTLAVYSKALDIVKAQFRDPQEDLSDIQKTLLDYVQLSRLTPDQIDEKIYAARNTYKSGSYLSELTPEQLEKGKRSMEGHGGNKYGAFVYGHLKSIENTSKYAAKLGKYAHDDMMKYGGTGHYFRNKALSLGIKGINPKVISFAWLLLAPRTSELGTMDSHMTRILSGSKSTNTFIPGIEDRSAGHPLNYYGFERMLKSLRDEMGYSDMPLGQFQWVMWDLIRRGETHWSEDPEPGVDHRTVKVKDPLPHHETIWPRSTTTRKTDPEYHPAPWMLSAYEARTRAIHDYMNEHGGYALSDHPDPDNPRPPQGRFNYLNLKSRRRKHENDLPLGVIPEGHQRPHHTLLSQLHTSRIVHDGPEDIKPGHRTGEEIWHEWNSGGTPEEEASDTALFIPYTGPKYEGEDDPMHHNSSVEDDWAIVKLGYPPADYGPQFQQDVKQRLDQGVEPLTPEQRRNYYVRGYDWETIPENIHALHSLMSYPLTKPLKAEAMQPEFYDSNDDNSQWDYENDRPRYEGHYVMIGGRHHVRISPLLSRTRANSILWHELQHAYQQEERRMRGDYTKEYWNHPDEVDARGMEDVMKSMPLTRRAEPYTHYSWLPNEHHLSGEWNDKDEMWQLSHDQMADYIKRYRTDLARREAIEETMPDPLEEDPNAQYPQSYYDYPNPGWREREENLDPVEKIRARRPMESSVDWEVLSSFFLESATADEVIDLISKTDLAPDSRWCREHPDAREKIIQILLYAASLDEGTKTLFRRATSWLKGSDISYVGNNDNTAEYQQHLTDAYADKIVILANGITLLKKYHIPFDINKFSHIREANIALNEASEEVKVKEELKRDPWHGKPLYTDPNGLTVWSIPDEHDLRREGELMGHCIGSYTNEMDRGGKFFSVRDKSGMPHGSMYASEDGRPLQFYGRLNHEPKEEYQEAMANFSDNNPQLLNDYMVGNWGIIGENVPYPNADNPYQDEYLREEYGATPNYNAHPDELRDWLQQNRYGEDLPHWAVGGEYPNADWDDELGYRQVTPLDAPEGDAHDFMHNLHNELVDYDIQPDTAEWRRMAEHAALIAHLHNLQQRPWRDGHRYDDLWDKNLVQDLLHSPRLDNVDYHGPMGERLNQFSQHAFNEFLRPVQVGEPNINLHPDQQRLFSKRKSEWETVSSFILESATAEQVFDLIMKTDLAPDSKWSKENPRGRKDILSILQRAGELNPDTKMLFRRAVSWLKKADQRIWNTDREWESVYQQERFVNALIELTNNISILKKYNVSFDINKFASIEDARNDLADIVREYRTKEELKNSPWNGEPLYTDPETGLTVWSIEDWDDLHKEGKLMEHCIGGYGDQLDRGGDFYSVRDKNGVPHASMYVVQGTPIEFFGRLNHPPKEEYQKTMEDFSKMYPSSVNYAAGPYGHMQSDPLLDEEYWEDEDPEPEEPQVPYPDINEPHEDEVLYEDYGDTPDYFDPHPAINSWLKVNTYGAELPDWAVGGENPDVPEWDDEIGYYRQSPLTPPRGDPHEIIRNLHNEIANNDVSESDWQDMVTHAATLAHLHELAWRANNHTRNDYSRSNYDPTELLNSSYLSDDEHFSPTGQRLNQFNQQAVNAYRTRLEDVGLDKQRQDKLFDDWELVSRTAAADLNGTMVALDIPHQIGRQMIVPGGEPLDQLHMTMAYLPEGLKNPQAAHNIIHEVSNQFGPIGMSYDKLHHFPESKDGDIPMVALMKGDRLNDLHQAIKSGLQAVGENVSERYPFKPHVTLKYLKPNEMYDGEDPDVPPFEVPHVSLHDKTNVVQFPFTKAPVTAKVEDDWTVVNVIRR